MSNYYSCAKNVLIIPKIQKHLHCGPLGLQMTIRNQGPGPGWEQGVSPRKPFIPGALVSFICKWEGKKITRSGGKRKNPHGRRGVLG